MAEIKKKTTEIVNYFIKNHINLAINGSVNKEKEEFFVDNKRIGSFSRSNNGIVIRISNGILSSDKQDKLKSLVNELIKEPKNK